jgi:2-methylcitrate dehydratase PrpD
LKVAPMLAPRTMDGLLDLASLRTDAMPSPAREMARLSLFDWFAVARAGAQEPVARIIRGLVADEAGKPAASVIGLSAKVPARAAALANGAISHALDYDDTHFAHIGHPSVAILPAALAVGEELGASGAAVLDAFLVGAEASIRIGVVVGRPHYDRGFHQTATAGAFGATVAAARVMGLTRDQTRQALSLVATRASGLKSQFGSMGKPYNAGVAASNGVEAAALARRGFVSADDGVGGAQGFVDAHVDYAFEEAAWSAPPPATFLFEDVKHKLHACCHGLHAAIEALREMKARRPIEPDEVAAVRIRVNPRWLAVCDIKRPRTGLEAKFSYAMTTAMTLRGVGTAADRAYDDALCKDPKLTALLSRIEVAGDESLPDTGAVVRVELREAPAVEAAHDLAERVAPETLQRGLRAKAASLLGEVLAEALWRGATKVGALSARDLARLMNA